MDKIKVILNHYITRYLLAVFCILAGFALKGSTLALAGGFILMVIGWATVYSAFRDSYTLQELMKDLYTEKEEKEEKEQE
jgi:small neutral amino acid transporter SnatA (MarC family)